jgi:adenylate cyclase
VRCGALRWEVDDFSGAHKGLVIAEIEMPNEMAEFERPSWLGEEVTDDKRYYNASLAADGLPRRN